MRQAIETGLIAPASGAHGHERRQPAPGTSALTGTALQRRLTRRRVLMGAGATGLALVLPLSCYALPASDARLGTTTVHPTPLGPSFVTHTGAVSAVAFSPDVRILASSSWDGTLQLWDTAAHGPIGHPFTPPPSERSDHSEIFMAMSFSPDGEILATGSADNTVRLWDVTSHKQSGTPLAELIDDVCMLAFSRDGKILATADKSGTIQLWEMATRKPIGILFVRHDASVISVAFSQDGETLAAGDRHGAVQLWRL